MKGTTPGVLAQCSGSEEINEKFNPLRIELSSGIYSDLFYSHIRIKCFPVRTMGRHVFSLLSLMQSGVLLPG